MRVAIFIDGKNFHSSLRDRLNNSYMDFPKLASWIVQQVGRPEKPLDWVVHYYTGVDVRDQESEGQKRLSRFLGHLERLPMFHVRKVARKDFPIQCRECGFSQSLYKVDVEVEVVVDMLSMAQDKVYDIAVLVSTDPAYGHAVERLQSQGIPVWVATWGEMPLSTQVRANMAGRIDLMDGLSHFGSGARDLTPSTPVQSPIPKLDPQVVIDEVRRAMTHLVDGFVGLGYFLNKWRSANLPESPGLRRALLHPLVQSGQLEVYRTDCDHDAIRIPTNKLATMVGSDFHWDEKASPS